MSMKTPERPLQDYMAEAFERTGVRIGVPLHMEPDEFRRTQGGNNNAYR